MKTAVSVPDDLFERAERLAARTGRSRSALYSEALAEYLERVDDEVDEVTAALDAIYDDSGQDGRAGAAAGRRLVDAGAWEW